MNKRKRVAMLKHRQKRKRYEALRKAAVLAGNNTVAIKATNNSPAGGDSA